MVHAPTKYKCGHRKEISSVEPCDDPDCGIIMNEKWLGLKTNRQQNCPDCPVGSQFSPYQYIRLPQSEELLRTRSWNNFDEMVTWLESKHHLTSTRLGQRLPLEIALILYLE
jgi:hypothetical protein